LKLDRHLLELALTELVLVVLYTIFDYVGLVEPGLTTKLAVAFALGSIAAILYAFALIRRQKRVEQYRQAKEQARKRALGKYYPHGEMDSRDDMKRDINSLTTGSNVIVCGTGATAVVYIASEVYEAIKRGVNFEVFLLDPNDELVDRIAEVEPDFESRVFTPMVNELHDQAELRKSIGADWCDGTLKILSAGGEVCQWHDAGHKTCSQHTRAICTSANIWKRIAERVDKNDQRNTNHHGKVIVRAYRRIPLLKAWRFHFNSGHEDHVLYYVADYIYHSGVGVDNPMRRVDKRDLKELGDETDSAEVVNIDRVDSYLTQISDVCTPL
jgi:hypothetical protein